MSDILGQAKKWASEAVSDTGDYVAIDERAAALAQALATIALVEELRKIYRYGIDVRQSNYDE